MNHNTREYLKACGKLKELQGTGKMQLITKMMQGYAQLYLNKQTQKEECFLHSTDFYGKCFKCGEQVFTRKESNLKAEPEKLTE